MILLYQGVTNGAETSEQEDCKEKNA